MARTAQRDEQNFGYAAFISYSHSDSSNAAWLHRLLESYRLPKEVAEASSLKTDRIYPVFRDQDELSAASDLTKKIQDALRASEALVVLCSPAAAQSVWVNREIEYFCSLGRADRVFGVLLAGEPYAAEPAQECFPPALKAMGREVFAPDARRRKTRRSAGLKLLAGLHDLRLGQLVERDQLRRRARRVQFAAALVASLSLAGGLSAAWWSATRVAASERVVRLSSQMRAAFEDRHPEQALTILGTLWSDLPDSEKDRYSLVAGAWTSAFPRVDDVIGSLPADTLFQSGKRTYYYGGNAIRSLPFAVDELIAYDKTSRTALSLTLSGEIHQWSPGDVAPHTIIDSPDLTQFLWNEAIVLKGGVVLFQGSLLADKMPDRMPVILAVMPGATSWSVIWLSDDMWGREPYAGLYLSPDCDAIAWAGADEPTNLKGGGKEYGLSTPAVLHRISWDTDAGRDAYNVRPVTLSDLTGYSEVRPEHDTNFLRTFATRCAAGPVDSVAEFDATRPSLDLPANLNEWWSQRSPAVSGSSADLARVWPEDAFVEIADRLQRGKYELTTGSDDLVASFFPGGVLRTSFREGYAVVGFDHAHQTPGGYDHGEVSTICVDRGGRLNCKVLRFHWMLGDARFYPDFLYVPGGTVPDDPLFTLVGLPGLNAVAFQDRALSGERAVDGAATALSPDGRRFVTANGAHLLTFELDGDLQPAFEGSIDTPSLSGAGVAAMTFVGMSAVVILRNDGLLIRFDLVSGQEDWRLRLPIPKPVPRRVRVASLENEILVIRLNETSLVVDGKAGLPLGEPAITFGDDDARAYPRPALVEPDADAMPGPSACPGRDSCLSGDELREMFKTAGNETPWIQTAANGETIARDELGNWKALVIPSADKANAATRDDMLRTIRCRTGWTSTENSLRSFDPFAASAANGQDVSVPDLLRRCG